MNKKRIEYIDNIKALSCLAVIFLHSWSVLTYQFSNISTFSFTVSIINDSLVRFAVPLFLMASGATLLGRVFQITIWTKKIFTRLLCPFLFWWLVYCAINHHHLVSPFHLSKICYHFCFVGTILTSYILYPIISPWLKEFKTEKFWYFLILWLGSTIILSLDKKFDLYNLNFINLISCYPILGYFLSKLNTYKYRKISVLVFILSVVATATLTLIYTYHYMALDERWFNYDSPTVAIMSLSLFLIIKDYNYKVTSLCKIRNFISEHSYAIYFIHPLFITHLYKIYGTTNTLLAGWIIFILCTIASSITIFLSYKIFEKIPFLNKFSKQIIG